MKTRKQILWLTQTALFLGLTVAAQVYITSLLGSQLPGQLVAGSLVNLFLVLSVLTRGFFSGAAIGSLAPFIAFSLGRMPHFWMLPFVILGNISIVFAFWLICGKNISGKISGSFSVRWGLAAITGSALKFITLWLGVTRIFVKFILVNDASLNPAQIEKMSAVITLNFSFPQLATALSGCVLAYIIYPVLKKTVIKTESVTNAK
ncbi:MAG: hypothetical protein FWH10_04340 [Oscillospiraceae bacterium]|nr:hypothetical protein [Oscillospiraceae bacterium]